MFQGLNISASAIKVQQYGINIVSNNIANMNTEGYSKQKLNLGTLAIGSSIGNSVTSQVKSSLGVEMINVERYTTTFNNSYYREQISEQSNLNKQTETLENITNIFDELEGNGLDRELENFYQSLDNLNQNPSESSARINFVDAASALTDSMNNISSKLNKLKSQSIGNTNSEMKAAVSSLNQELENLAGINKMLATSQNGTLDNNNLLDKRDAALKELAKYGNFKTDIKDNGTVNISLGGTNIVSGSNIKGNFSYQDGSISLEKDDGLILPDLNNRFNTGLINGILKGVDDINTTISSFDSLAKTVADTFNSLQTREGAYYIDGNKLSNENIDQYKLFTTKDNSDTTSAANITINPLLTSNDGYNKIAAAYTSDNDMNAVGNSNNISSMIETKESISEKYDTILAKITSKTASKSNSADTQNTVVKSLDNKIKEQTGVDLNEELADLVKYQTTMEASARVFAVCNEVLDTIVNLGR